MTIVNRGGDESLWLQHLTLIVVIVGSILILLGMFLFNLYKVQNRAQIAEFSMNLQQSIRSKKINSIKKQEIEQKRAKRLESSMVFSETQELEIVQEETFDDLKPTKVLPTLKKATTSIEDSQKFNAEVNEVCSAIRIGSVYLELQKEGDRSTSEKVIGKPKRDQRQRKLKKVQQQVQVVNACKSKTDDTKKLVPQESSDQNKSLESIAGVTVTESIVGKATECNESIQITEVKTCEDPTTSITEIQVINCGRKASVAESIINQSVKQGTLRTVELSEDNFPKKETYVEFRTVNVKSEGIQEYFASNNFT